MKDNFYISVSIGLLIGLLIILIGLLMYIIITEAKEEHEIKSNHLIIIKGQENISNKLDNIQDTLKQWELVE